MKMTHATGKNPPRVMVDTGEELARRLGCNPSVVSRLKADPEWRAKVMRNGRFIVAEALEDQKARHEKDLARVGGPMQALKMQRLAQQIKKEAVLLAEVEREEVLSKKAFEAKSGEWLHKDDMLALCSEIAAVFDRAVTAVGQVTRSVEAEAAAKEQLDAGRRQIAEWVRRA